jgi:hypothetical protein
VADRAGPNRCCRGGGGSGFTPDGTGMTNGVNEGDGEVTITYTPEPGCDDPPPRLGPEPEPPGPKPVTVEPRFAG